MKFYGWAPFALLLTPEAVRDAARTLSAGIDLEAEIARFGPATVGGT